MRSHRNNEKKEISNEEIARLTERLCRDVDKIDEMFRSFSETIFPLSGEPDFFVPRTNSKSLSRHINPTLSDIYDALQAVDGHLESIQFDTRRINSLIKQISDGNHLHADMAEWITDVNKKKDL